MPKATKRERQRQNRDARRAAMQADEKKRRRFRSIRLFVIILAAAVALAFVVSLMRGDDDSSDEASGSGGITCTDKKPSSEPTDEQFASAPPMTIDPTGTYQVTLDTSCGDIPITLDAAASPQTVNNFVFLAEQGFYDGTTFHRVVSDFVDQGGDPEGTGTGGPGYSLPDEPVQRAYAAGDVAMARGAEGIAGSQFFLVVSDNGAQNLGGPPGQYNLVGTMSSQGLKVAKKINSFAQPDETPSQTIYVFSTKVSGTTPASTTTPGAP